MFKKEDAYEKGAVNKLLYDYLDYLCSTYSNATAIEAVKHIQARLSLGDYDYKEEQENESE